MGLKERREIVALAREGSDGVLVTLVRATGSSYRRPGARLLAAAGKTAGTISGGCLEADLLRRAAWRVRGGAVMQRYDTGFDDTAEMPFGLGCGGLVDLLLEGAHTPEAHALLEALQATQDGEPRRVATRLPDGESAMQRIVLDGAGDVLFASATLPTDEVVRLRAAALGTAQNGVLNRAETQLGIFCEDLPPAQRLIVFGAGEDAKPLVRVACEVGWTVVVADGRPHLATSERFPQAEAVVVADTAEDAGVRETDAVVLMTHSFDQDRRLLEGLLPLRPRYLGLLGARQRSALLLREAARACAIPLAEAVARTHAPIGLELGGDGPECIALAITAEVQAVLHGIEATSRGMAPGEVEALLATVVEVPAAARCALDAVPADSPLAPALLGADAVALASRL